MSYNCSFFLFFPSESPYPVCIQHISFMTHWPRFGCDVAICGKRITCIHYAVIWTNSSVISLTHMVDLLSLTALTKPRKYTDSPFWERHPESCRQTTPRALMKSENSRFQADQLFQGGNRQMQDISSCSDDCRIHAHRPLERNNTRKAPAPEKKLTRIGFGNVHCLFTKAQLSDEFVTWYEELQFSNALLWDSEIKLQRFQRTAQILFTPTFIADKLNGLEDYDSH